MTQPDEFFPPGAANYDSFAGFSDTSQSDYEYQINNAVNASMADMTGTCDTLNTLPFYSGLADMGDTQTNGVAGGMVTGSQMLADFFCTTATNTYTTGTTPQDVMAGTQTVADATNANTFAQGLVTMGQDTSGPTGTAAADGVNGTQALGNLLCALFNCSGVIDSGQTTPQAVADGAQTVSDAVGSSPFAFGLVDMGQQNAGPTGNNTADGINGAQFLADLLCGLASGTQQTGTTPQTVAAGAEDANNTLDSSPFAQGIFQMGGNSGNRMSDGVNGAQNFFGQLCGMVTGDTDVSATSPQNVLDTTQSMIDRSHSIMGGTGTGRTANDLFSRASSGGGMLFGGSPLNAFNLFGSLRTHQTTVVSASSVNAATPNLLVSPDFPTADSMETALNWSWDGTQGVITLGSAKVVAAGYLSEMLSNEVTVAQYQSLDLSIFCKWEGLEYTGINPIVMGVTTYWERTEVGDLDVAVVPAPAADGGWTELTGTFEVPSGVDEIRMRFSIPATVTAGTVWWDQGRKQQTDAGTTDNVVQSTFGWGGTGWSHRNEYSALSSNAQALTTSATRIAALEASVFRADTDILAQDLFERVDATGLGADWTVTYSGGGGGLWCIANGHDAAWAPSGSSARQVICRYTKTGLDASFSDYQEISAIIGSSPQQSSEFLWISQNNPGMNDLYGRMSADELNWIRARFTGDKQVRLDKCVGGVISTMASGSVGAFGAGSTLTLLCGAGLGLRYFAAGVNGQVVLTAQDLSSNVGDGFRGWGHGGYADGDHNSQQVPGRLNSWTARDQ